MSLSMLAVVLALQVAAPPPPEPSIEAVRFMAGHWVGGDEGDLSEEIWSEPAGNGMLGMWRYVSGGQARVLEILTLSAEAGTLVLRLRHFDGQLVAREDKGTPVVLKLVEAGAGRAVFEGPQVGAEGNVRLTYRADGADALVSTLEKGGKPQEFRFRRRR